MSSGLPVTKSQEVPEMKSRPWAVRAVGMTAVPFLGLVLVSLLWMASAESQSTAVPGGYGPLMVEPTPTDWPPCIVPPEIYKVADDDYLGIGDPVDFSITMRNVGWPNETTWYDVTFVDDVPAEFQIDDVAVDPPGPTPVIVGNAVTVTVPSLGPDEWFAVAIECTLAGPAGWYDQLTNEAGVWYSDSEGHQYGPEVSSDTIRVHSPLLLPLVMNNFSAPPGTPTLYAISNPSGLNDYLVDWSTAPRADSYRLQEALRSDFSDGVLVYDGSQTEYSATAQQPTRYYYRVRARNSSGFGAWSNVRFTDVLWELEPNDDGLTQANGPILSGLTYHGKMFSIADEKDYFYFELVSSDTVELWLSNIPGGYDLDLVLRREDLTWLAQSTNPGNAPEHILLGGLEPGIYKIQVFHRSGEGSNQGYDLTADFD